MSNRWPLLPILSAWLLLVIVTESSFALTTTVWFDSTNKWHRDMQYHPEQVARVDACMKALDGREDVVLLDVSPEAGTSSFTHAPFSEAELDHARTMLLKVHSEELVTNLESRCRNAKQRRLDEGKAPLGFVGYVDADTFLTTETYDVCLRATAAWIRAVDHALAEPHSSAGFALTRPPGHHATFRLSNGFCLFNFAAAAAVHALESNPDLRVSIFDWDVHYGQGVADIMQRYPRARYASIHQSPAFPYSGTKLEVQGEHNNILTVPIIAETTWTCGYREKFEGEVLPFLGSEWWKPDLLLVCAGYDALDSDELASVSLCAKDYAEMTKQLLQHLRGGTKQTAVAMGLEGGYQLREQAGGGNLADAVDSTVHALSSYE
jgi:acetoin utilization deacetylase AcuC-like enzyme